MWDRAGKALKRFWGALSGGKYVAGQDGPVNFENLQPIPVINVMEYGADDGDKAPKLYVPLDSTGEKLVHDASVLVHTNIIQAASSLMQYTTQNIPSFTATSTTATPLIYKHRRIGLVAFTSNAAGNLAADVELVPLLAGHYGCIEWKGLFSVGNAGGTATLVIHGNAALETLVSGTLVAGQLDTANQAMILKGDADNQNIVIDTTSAGLGNAQSYKAVFEYWYET